MTIYIGGAPGQQTSAQPTMTLARSPESIATVTELRYDELQIVSTRLGRLTGTPKGKGWAPLGWALLGAGLGGVVAAVPTFAGSQSLPMWATALYVAVVLFTLISAATCALAHRTTDEERAESVGAIKEDFDAMLATYDAAKPKP